MDNQILLQPSAESARAMVADHPETYDALLAFTPTANSVSAAAAATAAAAAATDRVGGPVIGLPLVYSISMNHSDVPAPGLRFDLFDVIPSRDNALSLYQKWVWALVERSIPSSTA